MVTDNANCYVSGWGLTHNDNLSFGLSRKLKYINVRVVDPEECKEYMLYMIHKYEAMNFV